MNVTWNWLKDFVDCSAFSPEEVARRLTMAGLEVEGLHKTGAGLDSVVVALLESVEAHPNAERLTLCRATTGSEEFQVVCGATNHRTGDKVALALVGTALPGDVKIKKSKIRGIESQGMFCSEKELGLAEASEGIIILPADAPLGKPVFEVLGLKDACFEIGLTPNRADCLSVLGVAREVAALTGMPLQVAPPTVVVGSGPHPQLVTVEEPQRCPRYAARLIHNVQIGPSPAWMARRLEAVGIRSINNVVDVTNYVLMELGQPLHAFDFNILREKRIVVKNATPGERFVTLDGKEHVLDGEDLVICDGCGPVALAGVMGGENSEIQADTHDVLIESAYFDPATIRRTSKRLGMHTEASHRFERGTDIEIVPVALERAVQLICELSGGVPAEGHVDVCAPHCLERPVVEISARNASTLLGIDISRERIRELLESIKLKVQDGAEDRLQVTVPSFRHDLEREVDLIEEVARLHGYEHIPAKLSSWSADSCTVPEFYERITALRYALVADGFAETINYSFVAPAVWDKMLLDAADPRRNTVTLLNPLTEEQSVMRTMLAPSMLETVARNLARGAQALRLFELRPVFAPHAASDREHPALERPALCLAMCGRREPEGWAQSAVMADFYDLKGVVENLLEAQGIARVDFVPETADPFWHPGKSCLVKSGNTVLGAFGEIHPEVAENFEMHVPILLCELDLQAFFRAPVVTRKFCQLSRYPNIQRDTAFLVDQNISAKKVLDTVRGVKIPVLEEIVLFDLYCGQGIPEGKKSMAVRVRYRSGEKTLTDDEVSALHQKIVDALIRVCGAVVR
ncbi:MAG: phenylalanine--tRNA ligase subunit beta [bacterium]|nr:phenylalanine--tRNA ligase subunit beta [bacterium]